MALKNKRPQKLRAKRTAEQKAYHAKWMRQWRKTHPMTPEQRMKDTARSYAGVYLRRGKIVRTPCVECGAEPAEMHHPDYSKPLEIMWLCRPCHMELHRRLDEEAEQQQFDKAA